MSAAGTGKTSVHLLFGDDEFPVREHARELVNSLVPADEQALGLEVIDGAADTVDAARSALRSCIAALRTMGFLSDGKVVWLRDASFLGTGVVGRSENVKALVVELAELVKEGLPDGQVLVITAVPKVDKRQVLYKTCKSCGKVQEFEVPKQAYKMDDYAIAQARAAVEKAELRINDRTLKYIVEKVGVDTRQLTNEVEKLAVFLGDRKEITAKDVTILVSSTREALSWDLQDALGSRKLEVALRALRRLLFQKASPVGLVMGLERRVSELLLFRQALDSGWLRLEGSASWPKAAWNVPPGATGAFDLLGKQDPRNYNPFRAGKLGQQAQRFELAELRRMRLQIVSAHEQLVSATAPKETVLELLLLRMLGTSPVASSHRTR